MGLERQKAEKPKCLLSWAVLCVCQTTGLPMSLFGGRGSEDPSGAEMETFLAEPNSTVTQEGQSG